MALGKIISSFFSLCAPLVLVLFFTACAMQEGKHTGVSSRVAAVSQCQDSRVAVILVGDGFFSIGCGCTEPPGTLGSGTTVLDCHVPFRETTVIFNFIGTILPHQIISSSGSSQIATPVVLPIDESQKVYSVSVDQAATTYSFEDAFGGTRGRIITP